MKTSPAILKFLKSEKRTNDLPLNVLRHFQEFEKYLNKTMQSYDNLPDFAAYSMRCFTQIEMFSMP